MTDDGPVRRHARLADPPVDGSVAVADAVILRPDAQPATTSAPPAVLVGP